MRQRRTMNSLNWIPSLPSMSHEWKRSLISASVRRSWSCCKLCLSSSRSIAPLESSSARKSNGADFNWSKRTDFRGKSVKKNKKKTYHIVQTHFLSSSIPLWTEGTSWWCCWWTWSFRILANLSWIRLVSVRAWCRAACTCSAGRSGTTFLQLCWRMTSEKDKVEMYLHCQKKF